MGDNSMNRHSCTVGYTCYARVGLYIYRYSRYLRGDYGRDDYDGSGLGRDREEEQETKRRFHHPRPSNQQIMFHYCVDVDNSCEKSLIATTGIRIPVPHDQSRLPR